MSKKTTGDEKITLKLSRKELHNLLLACTLASVESDGWKDFMDRDSKWTSLFKKLEKSLYGTSEYGEPIKPVQVTLPEEGRVYALVEITYYSDGDQEPPHVETSMFRNKIDQMLLSFVENCKKYYEDKQLVSEEVNDRSHPTYYKLIYDLSDVTTVYKTWYILPV